MSNYIITTDTTCDMPQKYYIKNDVLIIPMTYIIDDKNYVEFAPDALPVKEFYNIMREGKMPKTAQITKHQVIDTFRPILEDGNDILHLSFSSALSGTYNSCVQAAEELSSKYPDRKIYVFDTKCASMGEGLLLKYAIDNKKGGMSIDQNKAWLEDNYLHLVHWFTVDDLNHLYRGGRVSRTSAIFGSLLGIKPVLHVDDEGRLILMEKVRGRSASLKKLAEHMKETIIRPQEQTIFISHGDCLEDAKKLAEIIKDTVKVKDIMINPIGPVIGTHSGPGTVALFFIGSKR